MLNAVLSGKKTGTGIEGLRLQLGDAKGAEDVITASVFERLSYLPDDLFAAVFETLLGERFGPLGRLDFWPGWSLCERGVEPDVVLDDGTTSILVEAKRHDSFRQQSATQLADELQAGWQGEELLGNTVLLTLGGLERYDELTRQRLLADIESLLPPGHRPFRLVCLSWRKLFEVLEQHLAPVKTPGVRRLLGDISHAYAWHGLRTHPPHWLADLEPVGLQSSSAPFEHWSMT